MTALTDTEKLRLLVGERIPVGGTDADTFFSDDEIQMLLDSSDYGLNGAAVLGWSAKAAEYARLIDINESGGERKLSQRYRQAVTQLAYFQERVNAEVLINTTSGRVVGRSIDWLSQCQRAGVVYWQSGTHRFPVTP